MTQQSPHPVRIALDRGVAASLPEVLYVLRTLLRTAGFPWVIEWADASAASVDIAYGPAASDRAEIRIPAVPWEFRSAPLREPAGVMAAHGIRVPHFAGEQPSHPGVADGTIAFQTDVLFACYWWLTGAREPSYPRDRRDNLDLDDSIAVREGLLAHPIVSLLATWLRHHFQARGRSGLLPEWVNGEGRAAFCLTHDVDYPEIIRWIEVPRVLSTRGLSGLPLARDVATGRSHFWTFREWVDFAARLGTRPAFYFMARQGSLLQYAMGTPDDFYDVRSPRFRTLIAELRERGAEIGLHASYRAFESTGRLIAERERVEAVSGVACRGNRHHYWHLDPADPNETLRRHELAGLRYDSSLGLESYPGFRRGICHPFHVYHPGERRELGVLQLPPAWMDDHFGRRLTRNRIAEPDAAAGALLDVARATGGAVVVDYHSRGMNREMYPAYGPWLERFAASHLDRSLSYRTPLEVVDAQCIHEQRLAAESSERVACGLEPDIRGSPRTRADGAAMLRAVGPTDAEAVARQYVEAFPDLRLSQLGVRFAQEYFRRLLQAPQVFGFVLESGDEVSGFAIGYLAPSAVMARWLLGGAWRFTIAGSRAVLERPALLSALWRGAVAQGTPLPRDCDAFLVTIAVSRELRGRGMGRQLLEALLSEARTLKATTMALEVDARQTAAVSLYESFGFRPVAPAQPASGGPAQMLMRLDLTAAETDAVRQPGTG